MPSWTLRVEEDLRPLLPPARRGDGRVPVALDPDATLAHAVQSAGVPMTEVGALLRSGAPVRPHERAVAGTVVDVLAVRRPQAAPTEPARFLLDVHLGALARRLRLVGLDAAYRPDDIGDAALVARAAAESRVLLTRDVGLLQRRSSAVRALVRGSAPDDQLDDVLDRFAPHLAPWTRCPACSGLLRSAGAGEVAPLVEPGTARTQGPFARCTLCGRAYWQGAHAPRLQAVVARAERVVARRVSAGTVAGSGAGTGATAAAGASSGPRARAG